MQVDNWQGASASSAEPGSQQQQDQLVLTLTIASAEELTAAEAVIATFYGVQDSLANLQHEQLIQALLIADMIGAAAAAKQASQHVRKAAEQGLSAAALEGMAGLPAWPDCLLQLLPLVVTHASCCKNSAANMADLLAAADGSLIQRILVRVFGDLQAVWGESKLTELLLQLPCPAMQLLLSSDELQVPSEDIVLYTAQQYVDRQTIKSDRESAASALAELVRAPHLSDTVLHHAAVSENTYNMLLADYMWPMKHLLLLRRVVRSPRSKEFRAELALLDEAPSSWQLEHRQIVPALPAKVVWQLPVKQLKEACQKAFADQTEQTLRSPRSTPFSGFAWDLSIDCEVKETGILPCLLVGPSEIRVSFYIGFRFSVYCDDQSYHQRVPCLKGDNRRYVDHIFDFRDPMPGGWDEGAWAAQGLPTEGDLILKLEVSQVS